MEAVAKGSVGKIMWWIAHKAHVNCEHPAGSGKSPLHAALLLQNRNVIAYLLMNGADMYATDANDISPLNMIDVTSTKENIPTIPDTELSREITEMCMQLLRGDF